MVQVQEQFDGGKTLIEMDTNRSISLQAADSGWIDEDTSQDELDEFFISSEDEYK